jgi:lipopolysaccharide/colanic/teichoic acid biosynthesis glycosyltransferase
VDAANRESDNVLKVGRHERSGTVTRPGGWRRTRVQLGGGMIVAVLLPSLIFPLADPRVPIGLVQSTTAGTFLAVMMGLYILKNITVFPGMRASYYIMPSFLASYAIVLAVFLFFRLDYSRGIIMLSFLLCLTWTYLAYFMATREGRTVIAAVPVGQARSLLPTVPTVAWRRLTEPDLTLRYDALVADFNADLSEQWEAFLAEAALAGIPVFHIKQLRESLTGRVEIEHLSENSFGSLVPFMGYLKVRRIADFVAAIVAGILLLPALAIVAVLIRMDSPGPILFRQPRVGYRGHIFQMHKFRTMSASPPDPDSGRIAAMTGENDPRITRIGRFLRRSRIDELPQLINILKGEMSWIGPRPEAEPLSRWYESEIPFYRYRHIVPPGITGWAQVNQGHVAELDQVSSKLHYDFYYIKNFSPWLDVLIIIRTVQTILTGFGAK